MAKQVKGVRANKPNDSFGTINEPNLYRGKYREDVYKDDEEEQQTEQEAKQAETDTSEEATPKGDSFVDTKEETEQYRFLFNEALMLLSCPRR